MICSLQSYYPSNFIDNARVLTGEIINCGSSVKSPSSGALSSKKNDAAKFAIQLTLHLQSLLACIQDLYKRLTLQNGPVSFANSRWHGEGEMLSFHTTEEADDTLLSVGGIEMTPLPEVGTNIDLRGRTFFPCLRRLTIKVMIDATALVAGVPLTK